MRKQIYNLRTESERAERFCDVVIEDGVTNLEIKIDKGYQKISWEDLQYQVKVAEEVAELIR